MTLTNLDSIRQKNSGCHPTYFCMLAMIVTGIPYVYSIPGTNRYRIIRYF